MSKLKYVVSAAAMVMILFGATKANAWCDPEEVYCGFTVTADIWSSHDDISRYKDINWWDQDNDDYCTPGPDSSRWRGRSDIYRIHNPGSPFTITLDWEDNPNILSDDLVLVVLEDCDENKCLGSDYHTLEFSEANGNDIEDNDSNGIWIIVDSRTDIHKTYTLTVYCGDFPFGVELSSFTATRISEGVALNWSTASESDNDRFEVSRRELGEEAWTTVGIVAGNGTSSTAHDYQLIDRAVSEDAGYYYELAGVDLSGNRQVYSTVLVNAATPAAPQIIESFELIGNYPNPFNPTTNIRFSLAEMSEISLIVYDVQGRQVSELAAGMMEAGIHEVAFDAAGLTSGVYFAQLSGAFGSDVMKMVLMK